MLQLEATLPNMELLLEELKRDYWTATIAHEHKNVYWLPNRTGLRCNWWDSKLKKRRQKQDRVKISSNMADSDKHDAIMKAAAVLQAFYDSNHNPEKNMYSRKRKRTEHRLSQPMASRCRKPVSRRAGQRL